MKEAHFVQKLTLWYTKRLRDSDWYSVNDLSWKPFFPLDPDALRRKCTYPILSLYSQSVSPLTLFSINIFRGRNSFTVQYRPRRDI